MDMNEYIYICDGSIEGLLSCIYESYYSKNSVYDIVTKGNFQSNFAYIYKTIETNYANAQRVSDAIRTKISNLTFNCTVNTWLSDVPMRGYHILEYIRMGFSMGNSVNNLFTHDNVAFVKKTNQRVEFEMHRFLGICRFSKTTENIYLSTISPDHNILPLIANHFANRLSTERLIIYDEKRKNAVLSDKGKWIIVNDAKIDIGNISRDEVMFREMWKRYFDTIAIKERTNKKLQRQFVPVRYQDNIIEFNG